MSDLEPIPFLVGNLKKEGGTKHFSDGTKLYCFSPQWGDGYENIKVIGRHRGSGRRNRLVDMIIASKHISNWRFMTIYDPRVVRLINKVTTYWHWDSISQIEAYAKSLNDKSSEDS